ncbi:hypothetical protein ES708_09170 [subsurface metagenome]
MTYDRVTDKAIGHIVDITSAGLRIVSDTPVKKGLKYGLRLDLTKVMNFEQQVVFSAKCIWQKMDEESGAYISGFEIIEMADKDMKIIKQLIYQFGN